MSDVFLNGPSGRIEGRLSESLDPRAPIALVLHPHPLHGGTMNNKVVYNIHHTLFNSGFTVLRINFRGVGKSTGQFDNGIGELADANTALDWLQRNHVLARTNLVAGFSFGSWIGMELIMRRPEINYFLAVAPPVNKYDFSFLSPCPIPGLILQGDNDSVVEEDLVHDLVQRLKKQKNTKVEYSVVNGADHFFRNKIDELKEEITSYLKVICPSFDEQKVTSSDLSWQSSKDEKIFLD